MSVVCAWIIALKNYVLTILCSVDWQKGSKLFCALTGWVLRGQKHSHDKWSFRRQPGAKNKNERNYNLPLSSQVSAHTRLYNRQSSVNYDGKGGRTSIMGRDSHVPIIHAGSMEFAS